MKLLQINSVCGIRSTGRICTDIAEILRQEGHECKIAYGRESAPEKHRSIAHRIGSELDVKLHALRTRLFDSMGCICVTECTGGCHTACNKPYVNKICKTHY